MSIQATCTCGGAFKLKSELAGKRVKCPECGETFTVPESGAHSPGGGQVSGAAHKGREKIAVSCQCGRNFKAPSKLAGKQVACPACQAPLTIPPAEPALSEPEDPLGHIAFDEDNPFGDLGDIAVEPLMGELPVTAQQLPPSRPEERSPTRATNEVDGQVIALVSYLSLIGWCFAMYLHSKNSTKSSLAAFHLRQSLGITAAFFLFTAVSSVASVIPVLGLAVLLVGLILNLVLFFHWIYGLIAAARGVEDYLVPTVGDWSEELFGNLIP
jgi:uncharacterized membrane protein/endogenous inhibitor of DNA gyrase (YacG/DUF329 family)